MLISSAAFRVLIVLFACAAFVRADQLGEPFSNVSAGIKFRPPEGGEMTPGGTGSDEIVRFFNTDEKWLLVATKLMLSDPTPLAEREQSGEIVRQNALFFELRTNGRGMIGHLCEIE